MNYSYFTMETIYTRNENMKKMHLCIAVLTVLAGMLFADSLNQADKWISYTDKADGGTSTIAMTTANETIGGKQYMVITAKGAVTTKFQYGFVGMATTLDPETLAALKSAKGFKFKVIGDGNKYRVKPETTDIKDYDFYGVTFGPAKGGVTEITVLYDKIAQEGWGAKKKFMPMDITRISVHTVGQPIPAYELKMFAFEIIK